MCVALGTPDTLAARHLPLPVMHPGTRDTSMPTSDYTVRPLDLNGTQPARRYPSIRPCAELIAEVEKRDDDATLVTQRAASSDLDHPELGGQRDLARSCTHAYGGEHTGYGGEDRERIKSLVEAAEVQKLREQRLARQQWRERTDESATRSDDEASGDVALSDAVEE